MEKRLFLVECTFDFEHEKDELEVNFSIEGNAAAAIAFGEENYHKYLKDVSDAVDTVTEKINYMTIDLVKQGFKKPNKDVLKEILTKMLEGLEGE